MSTGFSILLARHPAVQIREGLCYGRTDVPLASGWEPVVAKWQQIWCDGVGFAQDADYRVFHSPATRCSVAARHFASYDVDARGRPDSHADDCHTDCCHTDCCHADLRLAELDFGAWENRLWSEVPRDDLDDWAADPMGYAPGGGETVEALTERVAAFWHERMQASQTCCIVTHGGPLRVMLALAENRAFRPEDPAPQQGQATLLHFSNNPGGFVAQSLPIR